MVYFCLANLGDGTLTEWILRVMLNTSLKGKFISFLLPNSVAFFNVEGLRMTAGVLKCELILFALSYIIRINRFFLKWRCVRAFRWSI